MESLLKVINPIENLQNILNAEIPLEKEFNIFGRIENSLDFARMQFGLSRKRYKLYHYTLLIIIEF